MFFFSRIESMVKACRGFDTLCLQAVMSCDSGQTEHLQLHDSRWLSFLTLSGRCVNFQDEQIDGTCEDMKDSIFMTDIALDQTEATLRGHVELSFFWRPKQKRDRTRQRSPIMVEIDSKIRLGQTDGIDHPMKWTLFYFLSNKLAAFSRCIRTPDPRGSGTLKPCRATPTLPQLYWMTRVPSDQRRSQQIKELQRELRLYIEQDSES